MRRKGALSNAASQEIFTKSWCSAPARSSSARLAEFDYAGTQACRALQEEGLEVVLVNSNPATIMTDKAMADKDLHRAA